MNMHKLNLSSTPTTSQTPTQSSVDKSIQTSDNLPPVQTKGPNSTTSTTVTNSSESQDVKKTKPVIVIVALLIALGAGLATGFGTYQLSAKSSPSNTSAGDISQVASGDIQAGDVFGSTDEKTFKDSAEGYLEMGGIDGEGSHKLLRIGGPSQTVYLTSSVTDLDKMAGMEVKVWGETFQGQKAGWLMDVGRVEVINPEGESPETE